MSRILVPLHARGIGFAWLLALVFCLRDLEMAVLYYPAGGEPLTVRLFTLEANGPEPVVAALAVVHVVITAALLGLGGFALRRTTV
jgi:iron(III) transport system permease protein